MGAVTIKILSQFFQLRECAAFFTIGLHCTSYFYWERPLILPYTNLCKRIVVNTIKWPSQTTVNCSCVAIRESNGKYNHSLTQKMKTRIFVLEIVILLLPTHTFVLYKLYTCTSRSANGIYYNLISFNSFMHLNSIHNNNGRKNGSQTQLHQPRRRSKNTIFSTHCTKAQEQATTRRTGGARRYAAAAAANMFDAALLLTKHKWDYENDDWQPYVKREPPSRKQILRCNIHEQQIVWVIVVVVIL